MKDSPVSVPRGQQSGLSPRGRVIAVNITIQGKKRKPDVQFLDDRMVCDSAVYLYSDISQIWTQKFLGASIDITYKGRHHGFKIDDAEYERAGQVAKDVQARLNDSFVKSASMVSKATDPERLYEFCKDNGLLEAGISSKWFCDRMKAIMEKLEEGEKLLIPFESWCGTVVVVDGALERVTSMQSGEAQYVCAITDRRLICYTFGWKAGTERVLEWEQVRAVKGFQNGLTYSILFAAKDSQMNTLLLKLTSTQQERILSIINAAGIPG